MSRVAIFTDSASDLDPAQAAAEGIEIVPLLVTFGSETYKTGVEMSTEEFWERMIAPDAPVPQDCGVVARRLQGGVRRRPSPPGPRRSSRSTSLAPCPGRSRARRSPATCCPTARSTSSTRTARRWRRGSWPGWASSSLPRDGRPPRSPRRLEARAQDILIYVALDTLEYLKKGGRISGASAAIGTLLSVKPIIKVKDGAVETVDKVRTRSKARERLIELIVERPIERLAILHTISPDVEAFRDQVLARASGLDPADVTIDLVGASVGPHLGPGCVGAAILYRS